MTILSVYMLRVDGATCQAGIGRCGRTNYWMLPPGREIIGTHRESTDRSNISRGQMLGLGEH